MKTSTSSPPSGTIAYNPDAFLKEFGGHATGVKNILYCFLLGAGASKSSDISLGGELAAEWLRELYAGWAPDGLSFKKWAVPGVLGIPDFDPKFPGKSYTAIFERRFQGRPDLGQNWLEEKFAKAFPSAGYYFLAQILSQTLHNIVITTNFDNLVADAFLHLAGHLPRIVADPRMAPYLAPLRGRPVIAKVHGDIGFSNAENTTAGVAALNENWKVPLRRILGEYAPIVIGWEGNDGSLMNFLTSDMVDDQQKSLLPNGIFWCYRLEKDLPQRLAENDKLRALAAVHTVHFIPIEDFDSWMQQLATHCCEGPSPSTLLGRQHARRLKAFLTPKKNRKHPAPSLPPLEALLLDLQEALAPGDPAARLRMLLDLAIKHPTDPHIQQFLALLRPALGS